MGKFGKSRVIEEAKERQRRFMKEVFLMSNNEKAKEVLSKKKNIGAQIEGMLYAHVLAISKETETSIRSIVEEALQRYVVDFFKVYPAVNKLQILFEKIYQEELDKLRSESKKRMERFLNE